MKLFIGSDHGGFELKEFLKQELGKKHEVEDLGCGSEESCDYPEFAEKVASKVAESKGNAIGILCCGTGIGMGIAANKVKKVRAAVVWSEETAKMAREHNNANVLCLGAKVLEKEKALELVNVFLESRFQGERHERRLGKIDAIEEKGAFPEPCVGALIFNEKNEVFLMKSPKWGGLYIVPGGHVETGETRVEALKREVKEETGLDVYDEKLFTLHDAVFPKEFHRKAHFLMVDYLVKAKQGEVKLDGKEGTEFVWMQPKIALKELKMDPYTKKALEDYAKIMDLTKVV